MSCICRRCQRVADAMESDLMADVDAVVADVIDVAFRIARVRGADIVGLEHVVHAMTSQGAGRAVLANAGIDVAGARKAAAEVMADGGIGRLGAVWDGPVVEPQLDGDVEAALEFAVHRAWDSGYEAAGLDDVLEVLMGYEPGDAALVDLFEIIKAPMLWQDGRYDHDERAAAGAGGGSIRQAGGVATAADPRFGASGRAADSGSLGERLDLLELRTQQDHERIAHALAELTRQRERLPAAEDWRSQMQELVGQIDRLVSAQRALETRVSALSGSLGSGAAAAGVVRTSVDVRAQGDADDDGARRLAGLVGMMERQARELERIANAVARLEASPRAANADGGDGRAAAIAADAATTRIDAVEVSSRAGGSGAAQSVVTAATQSRSGSGARSHAHVRADKRRGQSRQVRARRRSRRSFGRLRYTAVARLGLRVRPKRRERSWWPWLGDRDGWRHARSRGGRFRAFGERFGHRSGRSRREHVGNERRGAASMPREGGAGQRDNQKRFYLSIDDDIVDAPSIGPKTAERLRPARIFTVRDLLDADADEVAGIVTARHITAQAVRDWQDQSRLVLTVPFLRGTHAQLLVGAGFRTYEDLALADQATLMSSLLKFATTREGQSILRSGPSPDLEKVMRWMENALESEPARAA